MSKEILYRCTNRSGPDGACEYVENEELIPASKVEKDDDGKPLCPGKTVFGDPCGAVLEVAIGGGGEGPIEKLRKLLREKPMLPIAAGIVGLILISGVAWFLMRGDAILRLESSTLALAPGESAKIELSNIGKGTLKIKQVKFSSDAFSLESAEKLPEVKPGEKGSLRIQLAPEVKDSVQGTLTLDTNGTEKPVNIALSANVDPWSVFDRLSKNSKILKQE